PKKKSKGGFFGCRSKNALDSLPRNARGDNAAINRLQARNVFVSEATDSTISLPMVTEKHTVPVTQAAATVTPPVVLAPVHNDVTPQEEDEEARDVVADPVVTRPNTPGATRALSVSSKSGLIRRSLSLKRSGSSASTSLAQRAPPVSSADFADLPASSSSSSDVTIQGVEAPKKEPSKQLGDMASIRQARGRHQSTTAGHVLFPDISEDEYINMSEVPVPPSFVPAQLELPVTLAKSMSSLPSESESMRAVAAALESSTDTYRVQPGPSTGTPTLQPASPTKQASYAELRTREASQDTVSPLPVHATLSNGTGSFWERPQDESFSGTTGGAVPFQYLTNMARPVSIASLRSLARPDTPPRTSSRPVSPNGTCSPQLRQQRSFHSPLATQATFNGFPAPFFSGSLQPTLKHSASTASNASRRKPVPQAIPALEFEEEHRRHQSEQSIRVDVVQETEGDSSVDDVENMLGKNSTAEPAAAETSRDFASFVAKGKASKHTNKHNVDTETLGEGTLKRWGLTEAFNGTNIPLTDDQTTLTPPKKKMVQGPAGTYITDTANMRWCSALDEIKKALADDPASNDNDDDNDDNDEEAQTQIALQYADAVLAKLGVEA
ncbi:hypothetical protein BCV70DRAFT_147949, partial [Testicularia cyperi]